MSAYQIEVAPAAQRQLKKFSPKIRHLIIKKLEDLSHNPRPIGIKKLSGIENLYRIRVGDFRIIYSIDDKILLILVVKIGDRKEIYKNL